MDGASSSSRTSSTWNTLPSSQSSMSDNMWDNLYNEGSDTQSLWSDVYLGPPRIPLTPTRRYSQEHTQVDTQFHPHVLLNSTSRSEIRSPSIGEIQSLIEKSIVRKSRASIPSPQRPVVPPSALSLRSRSTTPPLPTITRSPSPFPQLSPALSPHQAEEDVVESSFPSGPFTFEVLTPKIAFPVPSPPQAPPFPSSKRSQQRLLQGPAPVEPVTFVFEEPAAKRVKLEPRSSNSSDRLARVSGSRRTDEAPDNVAEHHSLYPPSHYAIYCPWPTRRGTSTVVSKCDKLVRLTQFDRHLKDVHDLKTVGKCLLPLCSANGEPTGKSCGEPLEHSFYRHVLKADNHVGPLEGCKVGLIGEDGRGAERIVLPKLTCKYCRDEFKMYIGGHNYSLKRHLERCKKKPANRPRHG